MNVVVMIMALYGLYDVYVTTSICDCHSHLYTDVIKISTNQHTNFKMMITSDF